MPSPKAAATQAEVARYLKAVRAAGFDGGRVEIEKPDGTTIRVIAGKADDAEAPADDFDDLIEKVPNP